MTNASGIRIGIVLVLLAEIAIAADGAAGQAPLGTGGLAAQDLTQRSSIAIAQHVSVRRALVPCDAQQQPAFSMERAALRFWSAVFAVRDRGHGNWQIVVEDLATGTRFAHPINSAGAGQTLETGLVRSRRVRVTLEGPADAQAVCPDVSLETELQQFQKSEARGVFDRDERWDESSAELSVQADVNALRQWSNAVAELHAVGSRKELLPCTGFFISAHVLMTAHHCVAAQNELNQGLLILPNEAIPGDQLRLFLVSGVLDFSLIWVERTDTQHFLNLGSEDTGATVVWQWPVGLGKRISLKGCSIAASRPSTLLHRCDTSVGASGAPIQLRSTGAVIALHTDGCTGIHNGTSWCENFGSRISEIRTYVRGLADPLRKAHPNIAKELLPLVGELP